MARLLVRSGRWQPVLLKKDQYAFKVDDAFGCKVLNSNSTISTSNSPCIIYF